MSQEMEPDRGLSPFISKVRDDLAARLSAALQEMESQLTRSIEAYSRSTRTALDGALDSGALERLEGDWAKLAERPRAMLRWRHRFLRRMRELARAGSQREVLDRMLDAAAEISGRSLLCVVRGGRLAPLGERDWSLVEGHTTPLLEALLPPGPDADRNLHLIQFESGSWLGPYDGGEVLLAPLRLFGAPVAVLILDANRFRTGRADAMLATYELVWSAAQWLENLALRRSLTIDVPAAELMVPDIEAALRYDDETAGPAEECVVEAEPEPAPPIAEGPFDHGDFPSLDELPVGFDTEPDAEEDVDDTPTGRLTDTRPQPELTPPPRFESDRPAQPSPPAPPVTAFALDELLAKAEMEVEELPPVGLASEAAADAIVEIARPDPDDGLDIETDALDMPEEEEPLEVIDLESPAVELADRLNSPFAPPAAPAPPPVFDLEPEVEVEVEVDQEEVMLTEPEPLPTAPRFLEPESLDSTVVVSAMSEEEEIILVDETPEAPVEPPRPRAQEVFQPGEPAGQPAAAHLDEEEIVLEERPMDELLQAEAALTPPPITPARELPEAPKPPDMPEPTRPAPAASLSPEEEKLHNDARRFARLLVSEIKLYNEESVAEGRVERDLYPRLKRDIDRSREMYQKRVAAQVAGRVDYFHEELVRILAEGDGSRFGSGYPGQQLEGE